MTANSTDDGGGGADDTVSCPSVSGINATPFSVTCTATHVTNDIDVAFGTAGNLFNFTAVTRQNQNDSGASASAAATYVAPPTPTVTVTSSPNPSTPGQTVTLTATVSGSAGTPTGVVDFTAGIAFGGATDVTKIGTDGTENDSKSISAALYASYKILPSTFVDVIAGYGKATMNTQRFSAVGGVFLSGSRNASQLFGSVALTREQRWDAWKLAPYLRLDAVQLALDPYTEVGSPTWALNYQQMTTTSLNGILGARASYDIPMALAWGKLVALARLEYSTRLTGAYNQQLTYADLMGNPGGSVYTVSDQSLASNQLMGALGLQANVDSTNINIEYQVSAANNHIQSHTFRGGIRVGF